MRGQELSNSKTRKRVAAGGKVLIQNRQKLKKTMANGQSDNDNASPVKQHPQKLYQIQ